jgi:hypothetical protein
MPTSPRTIQISRMKLLKTTTLSLELGTLTTVAMTRWKTLRVGLTNSESAIYRPCCANVPGSLEEETNC